MCVKKNVMANEIVGLGGFNIFHLHLNLRVCCAPNLILSCLPMCLLTHLLAPLFMFCFRHYFALAFLFFWDLCLKN